MKTKYLLAVTSLVLILLAANTAQSGMYTHTTSSAKTELNAQNQPPRFGEDSVACVRNWSLYAEYYRQGNYKMALDPWRYMFLNCPLATQNIYIHGVNLVRYMYQNETDPVKREAIVDTLMLVYDQRIEAFGREGNVLGRKVIDLYSFRPNAVQEQYQMSERHIELEEQNAMAAVILINFQSTIRLAEAGQLEQVKIVENYDRAIDLIEFNLENNPEAASDFTQAKTNVEVLFDPYTSCENLVRVFGPRYEANPENTELLERITSMLERSGCTEDPLFFMATKSLHRLKPTAQSAFLMGRMENNNQNYSQALKYYQEAISLYEADISRVYQDEKFRAYMLMADIQYRHMRNMPQSRTFALRAADVKPDDGRPYLLIGEMYAASANDCGDDEFTKKVAFWPAVDMFNKARTVDSDPVVRERATQLINTYSQYFPSIELIFFHGYDSGDVYRVGCWINESTRIRPR